MNLGDNYLKSVNVSQPQLVHVNSKQSITASDDYYSFTSQESDKDDQTTIKRYKTPPMHGRSEDASHGVSKSEAKQFEATIPTIRPVKHKDPTDEELIPAPLKAERKIPRKPVSSSSSNGTVIVRPIDHFSPPTPGVDNTPYIQFAIDQLTRDQEVTHEHGESEASYSINRIIPDESLGNHASRTKRPQRQRPDPNWRQRDDRLTDNESVLLPAEPANDPFRYPKLDYKPYALRSLSLGAFTFCCLLMVAGLLFCAIWPTSHDGLWQYDGVSTGRYFVFQYLPTILAMFLIVWLQIIERAIYRIFPFVVLSTSRDTRNSGVLNDTTIFPTNPMIPNLSFFQHREPALGLCSFVFWLSLFTVPLQSCLFQTRYYIPEGIWHWTTVQGIAWTLFALYLTLVVAILLLILRIRHTGLKWDPVCLADLFTIFHNCNFLPDFECSEASGSHLPYFSTKRVRLGYWRTSKLEEAFYSIGEENVPSRRYPLGRNKMIPVTDLSKIDLEAQRPQKGSVARYDENSPSMRDRWIPWFLRDSAVLAGILIAIALVVAFVVVSFVNRAVQRGFLPQLPAPTTVHGFSPADFLYSFVPTFIGMLLFLLWQPIDMYFRALQPFANLSMSHGCSAEQSLLLDYTSLLPVEITFRAMLDRHLKVAWISFNSLLATTLPILGGGVFTAQYVADTQSVRMAADMSGYYALVVFVMIYALSFLIIWPTRRRHLPHGISTIGQLISFVYQSPLLADPVFGARTKIDLVTKLVGRLTGEKGFTQYRFGHFMGLDGVEHVGIHRLGDPNFAPRARQPRQGEYMTEMRR